MSKLETMDKKINQLDQPQILSKPYIWTTHAL